MGIEPGRTAPTKWGPLPPDQSTVNRVVERACRALAKQIKAQPWTTGVIVMAMPRSAPSLDGSFSGQEEEIQFGEVWAIGVHRSWQVLWNPETDQERLSSSGFYDYRV